MIKALPFCVVFADAATSGASKKKQARSAGVEAEAAASDGVSAESPDDRLRKPHCMNRLLFGAAGYVLCVLLRSAVPADAETASKVMESILEGEKPGLCHPSFNVHL